MLNETIKYYLSDQQFLRDYSLLKGEFRAEILPILEFKGVFVKYERIYK